MAARGTFELSNPDSIDMTLTITMSVKEWKVIKDRLIADGGSGEWYLRDTILQIIEKANNEFRFYGNVTKSADD